MKGIFFILACATLLIFNFGCSTTSEVEIRTAENENPESSSPADSSRTEPQVAAAPAAADGDASVAIDAGAAQAEGEAKVDVPVRDSFDKFGKVEETEKIRQDRESFLVKNYLKTAQNFANQGKYADAYEFVLEALDIEPSHADALRLKQLYGSKLGVRGSEITDKMAEAEDLTLVRIEQARMQIDNHIAQGRRFADQEKYKEAVEEFGKAKEILRWMPYQVADLEGKARQLDFLIQRAQEQNDQQQEALRTRRMAEAEQEARRQERDRIKTLKEQVRNLFRQANLAFEQGKYELSERFCREISRIDPENPDVEPLLQLVVSARHARTADTDRDSYIEEWKRAFSHVEQALVYQQEIMVFPSYEEWKKIESRGQRRKEEAERKGDTEQMRQLQDKLNEEISMDFTETPLHEVIDFIRSRTQINIVIDPSVYKNQDPEELKIDITVTDIKLSSVLNIILDMRNLAYRMQSGTLIITPRNALREAPVLRLYNVKDLTGKLNDFPGPELSLETPEAEGATAGVVFDDKQEGTSTMITEDQLKDLIENNISRDSWDEEQYSIDARHGTLIIRQSPEVHRQIESLLDDLRQATGLLVTIETRFITVQNDFLEDIGVDWRSLGAVATGSQEIPETEVYNAQSNPTALRPRDVGTGRNIRNMDDVIFGDVNEPATIRSIGTGRAAGAYYRYRDDFETRQRVENLFDTTLGRSDILTNRGGLSFQMAYVDEVELQAILRAVRKRQRSTMVTAPRLTVFNTQRANVSILNQIAYVRDYDVEIATNATIADPEIGTINDGVVLDVRPIISADRKYITLELQPTAAVAQQPFESIDTQLASSAFQAGTVTIQLPRIQMTRIKTTVTIPDGGTLLLGGLMEATSNDFMSGVPVLSDLPLLNFFFSRRGQFESRRSLLILVTGKITSLEESEPREGLSPTTLTSRSY